MSNSYRLLKIIGRGSFGDVWHAAARDETDETSVALKIGHSSLESEETQAELHGLQLIRDHRHPFLLQTHMYWTQENRLFIAMQLASSSLLDALKSHHERESGIPVQGFVEYIYEAAEILDYLHGHGIIHGGINPTDLLILDGHVRIADFGLVHLETDPITSPRVRNPMTAMCMAPELCEGHSTFFSDQYALAYTYILLRLKQFALLDSMMRATQKDQHEQLPLDVLNQAEQEIVLRALAKTPQDRFASCGEFATRLRAVVKRGQGDSSRSRL